MPPRHVNVLADDANPNAMPPLNAPVTITTTYTCGTAGTAGATSIKSTDNITNTPTPPRDYRPLPTPSIPPHSEHIDD